MEEITFIKRKTHTRMSSFKNPILKVELPNGRFLLSRTLAKQLGVKANDGLMFGFNQKQKTAYVVKDDEHDAFKIRENDATTYRFTSRPLARFFDETFDLLETGKSFFIFTVDSNPDKRGLYRLRAGNF